MAKKPPTGRTGRLARLGNLTSRVGSSYIGQRVAGVFQDEETREKAIRKLHIKNAQRVAETMGQLKGAAMKVGQTAALMLENMDLPPEVAAALGTLNNKAEPIPFEVIREDIEAELEAPLGELFQSFDPAPLGTASLGQAHGAVMLDGAPVVVKILHRGIEQSVDSDLAALKSMFITGRFLRRDRREIEALFAEIQERLHEELDYYQEAANLEFFKEAFRDVPGVAVPGTHPSRCTQRVLTMDRLDGVPFEDFLAVSDADARHRAGLALASTFHMMVYQLRALHADPHPGNYLFTPDGQVGLLDFGCVKRFDEHWMGNYARSAHAAIAGRKGDTLRLLRGMDVLMGDTPAAADVLWELCELMITPFRHDIYTAGQEPLQDAANKLITRIIRYPEIQAPREVLYLNRSLTGMYRMLSGLEFRYDYNRIFRPFSQHAIDVAEGRKLPTEPIAHDLF